MNKRIKSLIKQAGTDTSGKWMGLENVEKFTELLINETITVMTKLDYHGEWLGEKIKEHFEIKN